MNNGSNWMVGGKRVQLGVQTNVRGVEPNPCAGIVQNFDIRMDLRDRRGQRGASVNDRVFAEEDDLAGGGGFHGQ